MQPGSWHSRCSTAIKRNPLEDSAVTSLRLSKHGGRPALFLAAQEGLGGFLRPFWPRRDPASWRAGSSRPEDRAGDIGFS